MYPTLPFNFPLNNTSNLPMYLPNQKSAIPFQTPFIQKFPIQQQQPRNLPLQNQMSMLGLYSQLLQQQQRLAMANSNTISPSAPIQNKFSPMVIKSQSPSFEAQVMMAKRAFSPLQINIKEENLHVKEENTHMKRENLNVKEEETDDTDTSEKSGSGSKLLSSSKKITKTSIVKKAKKVKAEEQEGKEAKKTRMSWSPNEDALLLSLIEKHGKRWAQLAHLMGGRSGKQVRDRYLNVLVPNINRGKWTDEEDMNVWVLYREIGPQWCKIAARLDGRTEAQVKNRFYTYLKKHFEGK